MTLKSAGWRRRATPQQRARSPKPKAVLLRSRTGPLHLRQCRCRVLSPPSSCPTAQRALPSPAASRRSPKRRFKKRCPRREEVAASMPLPPPRSASPPPLASSSLVALPWPSPGERGDVVKLKPIALLIALVALAAMLTAACGGDGGGGEEASIRTE